MLLKILKVLLFFIVGFSLLALIFYQVDAAYQEQCALDGIPASDCDLIGKITSDVKSARWIWLAAIIAVYMLSNVFRAEKWQMLLRAAGDNPRLSTSFWSIMIGYFTNLGFPRAGELVRCGFLSRYENVPLERVIGTVLVDRAVDLVILAATIGLAFMISWDQIQGILTSLRADTVEASSGGGGLGWTVLIPVVLIAVAVGLYTLRNHAVIQGLLQKLKQAVQGLVEGLLSVRKVSNVPLFIFWSIGIWICYYLMVMLGFQAFDPTVHMGWEVALILFVLSSLGMLVPIPGGMGSYHFLVMGGLMWYGIDQASAFSFAMIMFVLIHLFGNILFGLLGLAIMPMIGVKRDAHTT